VFLLLFILRVDMTEYFTNLMLYIVDDISGATPLYDARAINRRGGGGGATPVGAGGAADDDAAASLLRLNQWKHVREEDRVPRLQVRTKTTLWFFCLFMTCD